MKNSYGDHFKKLKDSKSDKVGAQFSIRKEAALPKKSQSDIEQVRSAIQRVKLNKKKKLKHEFMLDIPFKAISLLLVGAMIAVFGITKPKLFDEIIGAVDINMFTQSIAQNADPKENKKEKGTTKEDAAAKKKKIQAEKKANFTDE
jgi:hypothetical protein